MVALSEYLYTFVINLVILLLEWEIFEKKGKGAPITGHEGPEGE